MIIDDCKTFYIFFEISRLNHVKHSSDITTDFMFKLVLSNLDSVWLEECPMEGFFFLNVPMGVRCVFFVISNDLCPLYLQYSCVFAYGGDKTIWNPKEKTTESSGFENHGLKHRIKVNFKKI